MRRAGFWAAAAVLAVAVAGCAQPPAQHSTTRHSTTRHSTQQAPRAVAHRQAASVRARQHVAAVERAAPGPRPNRCAHNNAPQKVIVSIRRQHLWMCAGHRLVRQSAVTTGIVGEYTNTPTGNYMIQDRVRGTTLTLNTGATYAVQYWIPFDAPLFGFHDSSWQTFPYGSQKYKTEGSHGCVHMPLAAIAFLYRWAARPTAVHIS